MGVKDEMSKKYFSDNEKFADVFNYYLFGGKQVIMPETLADKDAEELATVLELDGIDSNIRRYRDLLKTAVIKDDGKHYMLFLGIENQSNIDYIMPIRTMIYDGIRYLKQTQINRAAGTMPAYMLKPVITPVVYLSPDKWTAPLSLHDMMNIQNGLPELVNNYRINLISPYSMTAKNFASLTTHVSELLKFLKYSNDADALTALVDNDEYFRHMDRETLNMINIFTELNIDTSNEKEEGFDMCEAIKEMQRRSLEAGKNEGLSEGKIIGLSEGKKLGLMESIQAMLSSGMELGRVLEILKLSNEEYEDMKRLVNQA